MRDPVPAKFQDNYDNPELPVLNEILQQHDGELFGSIGQFLRVIKKEYKREIDFLGKTEEKRKILLEELAVSEIRYKIELLRWDYEVVIDRRDEERKYVFGGLEMVTVNDK